MGFSPRSYLEHSKYYAEWRKRRKQAGKPRPAREERKWSRQKKGWGRLSGRYMSWGLRIVRALLFFSEVI